MEGGGVVEATPPTVDGGPYLDVARVRIAGVPWVQPREHLLRDGLRDEDVDFPAIHHTDHGHGDGELATL